mmetsp:Transcript_12777/g.39245  ORF Transcript_12777/g.39245 Transcript_12777/m.39245 type:complete len:251 (+) Transcript_12777:1602-2354(+)
MLSCCVPGVGCRRRLGMRSVHPDGGEPWKDKLEGEVQGLDVSEALAGLLDALYHSLFSLSDPDSRVVELLVRLVLSVRISNLALQVTLLRLVKVLDAAPVCPLHISIDVHLDDAALHGLGNLLRGRPRAAVHDEEDRLLFLGARLLSDICLVLAQDAWVELHVSWLVDAVHVAKGGCHGEAARIDVTQSFVHGVDLLGLGVEPGSIDVLIVHSILLSAGDADLHLEETLHLGHLLEVLDARSNVLLVDLL